MKRAHLHTQFGVHTNQRLIRNAFRQASCSRIMSRPGSLVRSIPWSVEWDTKMYTCNDGKKGLRDRRNHVQLIETLYSSHHYRIWKITFPYDYQVSCYNLSCLPCLVSFALFMTQETRNKEGKKDYKKKKRNWFLRRSRGFCSLLDPFQYTAC